MKHPLSACMPRSPLTAFTLLLGLAGSPLTSACSGYYPLGDISAGSRNDKLVDESTAGVPLAAVLPAPDFTLDASSDWAPLSVGDMDGDGRDDMVTFKTNYATQVASVHLRYGGPRPANDLDVLAFGRSGADLVLTGLDASGLSVTPAGDVDGDGHADLLLRTGECNIELKGAGTYLVYGGPERLQGTVALLDVAAHFVPAPRPAAETAEGNISCNGISPLGRAGDMDGDGIDDFVITSPPLQTFDGEYHPAPGDGVYVFYGRAQRFAGEVAITSADAVFLLAQPMGALPLGDVNGDGRADLMIVSGGSYFVPGNSQRYSGPLDLPSHSTFLADIYDATDSWLWRPMDLDGDGLNDWLAMSPDYPALRVFYGRPGLFEDGFDPSQADFTLVHSDSGYRVYPVGDRDGDGRDELLDQFTVPVGPLPFFNSEVAISHGSSTRLSGSFSFPESEVVARTGGIRFPENPRRILESTIAAGDLDGDGAADLFTTSSVYTPTGKESAYSGAAPQLHVHYGVLAAPRQLPVR